MAMIDSRSMMLRSWLYLSSPLHLIHIQVECVLVATERNTDDFDLLRQQTIVRGKKIFFGQEAFPTQGDSTRIRAPLPLNLMSAHSGFFDALTAFVHEHKESIVFWASSNKE